MATEPTFRPLNPEAADLVPDGLFEASELARVARPAHKSGAELTALLERLTTHRGTLFPGHTYLDTIGTCRSSERPGGEFRAPLSAQTLTYCHRHDVRFHRSGRKRLHHPIVGRLDLDFEAMELPSEPGLQLNIYTAATGTPAADALKLLASWAATQGNLATEKIAAKGYPFSSISAAMRSTRHLK